MTQQYGQLYGYGMPPMGYYNDPNRVEMFLRTNKKFFEARDIPALRQKLLCMPPNKFNAITSVELVDPTTTLILSVLLGSYGVDRFVLGDIGMGVLKLLTGGLLGILTIIDWFTVEKRAKEKNFDAISNF